MDVKIKRSTKQCTDIIVDRQQHKEINLFFTADVHHDSPKSLRKKLKYDFDAAMERDALIFSFGDWFDMMQGRADPRRVKSGIRPEHNVDNYFDAVIDDSIDWLQPYAANLAVLSLGNHETAVIKNAGINPIQRVCDVLRERYDSPVQSMLYQGFIRINSKYKKAASRMVKIFFHHGKFGGIVTKGVLSVDRWSGVIPDADIIITGHTHDRWHVEKPRYVLKENGDVIVKPQHHIRLGCYKDEFTDGAGWAVERIAMPKNIGGYFVTIKWTGRSSKNLSIIPEMT